MHGEHAMRSEPKAAAGMEAPGKQNICDKAGVETTGHLSPNCAAMYCNPQRVGEKQKLPGPGNLIGSYNYPTYNSKPGRGLSFDSDNGFATEQTELSSNIQTTPMSKVGQLQQVHHQTSGLCNVPREMLGDFQHQMQRLPTTNALSPLFNPEGNIFDESFDFEDFMFGQSAGDATVNQFELVANGADLNFNCDSGRSSSQSSADNNTQAKIERDLVDEEQLFRTLSAASSGEAEPENQINSSEMNNFVHPTSKEEQTDKEALNRERGYSLSNDSGVEGCSYLDAAFTTSKSQDSVSIHLPDVSTFKPTLPQITQTPDSLSAIQSHHQNSHVQHTTASKTNRITTNSSSNEDSGSYKSASSEDFRANERTESRDTDIGEEDVYGGGETFGATAYPNHPFSLDVKNASKKTAYNEKWGVKVLKAWCVEANIGGDFERLGADELNQLLARFWSEVRKSNGDYYGRNSLFNLRAMINKHLKGKPYCVTFDIVTDDRFRTSNERLEEQLKILKGIGRTITHKQPISIGDLRKMYDSGVLGTSNPLALLRKVWFEVTLHFCHKGSESQEKLRKDSFDIFHDHNGRRYIARTAPTDADEIRMYETGGDLCPVKSFEFYLKKLHALQPRLFQQPRRKSTPDSPMWYGKAPIGEKALQQMMANISTASTLSKRYTNHCVRTTALEQFSNSRRKGNSLKDKSRNPGAGGSESFPDVFSHIISPPQMMFQPVFTGNQMHGADTQPMNDPNRGGKTAVHVHPYQVFDQQLDQACAQQYNNDIMQMQKHTDSGSFTYNGNGYRPGQKRGYVNDIPSYPPPAYNDRANCMQSNIMSPPPKRIRSEDFMDMDPFNAATYDHGYHNFDVTALPDPDAQQKQRHRFFGIPASQHCEKKQYDNVQKCYSDDSGTGRSLLSPISITTIPGENESETSMYNLQNSAAPFSETIVSCSSYGMMAPELEHAKSISPLDTREHNIYKNFEYSTSLHPMKRTVGRDRSNQIDSYQNMHSMHHPVPSPVPLSM
nr:uncharacterized protein LOC100186276 [Ciona intestinalis]|eukprot:XP_002125964.2 uncharacterized protein LOC100186276 [Ciona intestinalis]